jgi:hypothetical protein
LMETNVVGIVVDGAFGERLRDLARRMAVWVVDTPQNRAAAHAARTEETAVDVTTFNDGAPTVEDAAAGIIDQVELHHPRCMRLEIFGAVAAGSLVQVLRESGFSVAKEDGRHIVALRAQSATVPGD